MKKLCHVHIVQGPQSLKVKYNFVVHDNELSRKNTIQNKLGVNIEGQIFHILTYIWMITPLHSEKPKDLGSWRWKVKKHGDMPK